MADHSEEGQSNGENIDKLVHETTAVVAIENRQSNIFDDNASLRSALDISDSDQEDDRLTFDDLPYEMTAKIFAMLTLIERTKVELVSTEWQDIIRSIKDQKKLILTNKRTVGPKSDSTIKACHLSCHHLNDRSHKVNISSNDCIAKVLQRCPRLTVLVIDFESDFVFSKKQLAKDLNELCPLLEHFNWYGREPKKDFFCDLGILKNLSCWSVGIDDNEIDEAVKYLASQPKLHLKSLCFGKGVSKVLPHIDPTTVEALYTIEHEADELVNISRFHKLKEFHSSMTSENNYNHLQRLTTLIYLSVFDAEDIFNAGILEDIVKNNKKLMFLYIRLDMDVRGVPLISKYAANLSLLDILSEPSYYHEEDWIALSVMKGLQTLTLNGITTSNADMSGLRLVLKKSRSLNILTCRHDQDAHLDEEVILEIQLVISTVVESCPKNPSFEYFLREGNPGVKECMMTWNRHEYEY